MKVFKFIEFLKESIQDTPEQYVYQALQKIKLKLEKMFSKENTSDNEVKKIGDTSGSTSLSDLGLELQSCELSKYSKMYDNVKIKYSDNEFLYDLTVTIDLKDAVPTDTEKNFSDEDIKKAFIKFKKYNADSFDFIGEISKNIDIKDINQDLLTDLKLEIDKKFGGTDGEEDFQIQTE